MAVGNAPVANTRTEERTMTDLTKDKRAVDLAACMLFAINNFPGQAMLHRETGQLENWHHWFQRTLKAAGFELTEPKPPEPDPKKTVRRKKIRA
jgi:hypothetical protein